MTAPAGCPARLALQRVRLVQVVREGTPTEGGKLLGPESAESILRAILPTDREGFAVVYLNGRHECCGAEIVSVGSLNASIVHPREVFKGALLANAASVLFGHNHPSGDPEPSEEDLSITRRLVQAGEILGIGVLDHVVIGHRGCVSFLTRGLL